MHYKSIIAAVSTLLCACAMATSTPAGFVDDMDAAKEQAEKDGKPIIAVFTGSDWCKYCKILESNVFSKPDFAPAATKEFALLFVDNPSNKGLLTEKAKVENPKLTESFGINGFPTVILLDCFGQRVGNVGHGAGSPAAFLEQARNACKANAQRLKTAAEIAALKKGSPKRLQRIAMEIDKMDVSKHKDYPAYCEELLEKGGKWKKHLPYQSIVQPLQKEFDQLVIDIGHGALGSAPAPYIRKTKALLKKVDAAARKAPAGLKPSLEKLRTSVDTMLQRLEEEAKRRAGKK